MLSERDRVAGYVPRVRVDQLMGFAWKVLLHPEGALKQALVALGAGHGVEGHYDEAIPLMRFTGPRRLSRAVR